MVCPLNPISHTQGALLHLQGVGRTTLAPNPTNAAAGRPAGQAGQQKSMLENLREISQGRQHDNPAPFACLEILKRVPPDLSLTSLGGTQDILPQEEGRDSPGLDLRHVCEPHADNGLLGLIRNLQRVKGLMTRGVKRRVEARGPQESGALANDSIPEDSLQCRAPKSLADQRPYPTNLPAPAAT